MEYSTDFITAVGLFTLAALATFVAAPLVNTVLDFYWGHDETPRLFEKVYRVEVRLDKLEDKKRKQK